MLNMKWSAMLLATAASLAIPMAANAAILTFTGHFSNDTPPPMPNPGCDAGQVFVDFSPATSTAHGTSNFGDFGPSQSHCITLGMPYSGGAFSFAFEAGDVLFGTTAGYMTPTATMGVVNSFVTYTVTGGTGRFLNASGSITGTGLLDRRPARPLNDLDLTGTLNMPAVPEPATWLMMVTGFGLLGGAMRLRAARTAFSFATR